jgi:ABC-type transport system involved in multi-copper enzyme maturation permease subunit
MFFVFQNLVIFGFQAISVFYSKTVKNDLKTNFFRELNFFRNHVPYLSTKYQNVKKNCFPDGLNFWNDILLLQYS